MHNDWAMMTDAEKLLDSFRAYLAARAGLIPSRFLEGVGGAMHERELPARPLPCLRHLRGVASAAQGIERELACQLAAGANRLHWGQTYAASDFGENFLENYGWLEIFGTRGHFANDRVAGGFLILGPTITYPDHHHIAEEIYIPLTGGAGWRKGTSGFVKRDAGDVIHHPSNMNHAMQTGTGALLALYLWQGGPLAQRSIIGLNGNDL
jgi:hypothetical protein